MRSQASLPDEALTLDQPAERADTLGGTEGNEILTSVTAVVLTALLAVEGITIVQIHGLRSVHMFVGMVLIPPVLLKLASTGYRFLRYYTGRSEYVQAGPPPVALRLLGPIVVASTGGLFATGVALAVVGPGRQGVVLLLHKASFVVWLGALGLHVLGHLVRLPVLTAPELRGGGGVAGTRLRLGLVAAAVVLGAIVAVATLPLAVDWAHWLQARGD